MAKIRFYWIMY